MASWKSSAESGGVIDVELWLVAAAVAITRTSGDAAAPATRLRSLAL